MVVVTGGDDQAVAVVEVGVACRAAGGVCGSSSGGDASERDGAGTVAVAVRVRGVRRVPCAHASAVRAVRAGPGGRVYSVGLDQVARAWQLRRRAEAQPLGPDRGAAAPASVLVGTGDGGSAGIAAGAGSGRTEGVGGSGDGAGYRYLGDAGRKMEGVLGVELEEVGAVPVDVPEPCCLDVWDGGWEAGWEEGGGNGEGAAPRVTLAVGGRGTQILECC